MNPAKRGMAGYGHDDEVVDPGLPGVGDEGVTEVVEPEVLDTGGPAAGASFLIICCTFG